MQKSIEKSYLSAYVHVPLKEMYKIRLLGKDNVLGDAIDS